MKWKELHPKRKGKVTYELRYQLTEKVAQDQTESEEQSIRGYRWLMNWWTNDGSNGLNYKQTNKLKKCLTGFKGLMKVWSLWQV